MPVKNKKGRKPIAKVVFYPVVAVSSCSAGLLLFSAYSPYIHPQDYPYLSLAGLLFPILLMMNVLFLLFWLFLRSKPVFLTLAALLVCIPQIRMSIPIHFHTNDIPEGSLKLLSYNVMRFANLEKRNGMNPIITYLKKENADILCLQEYDVSTNADYLTQKDVEKELKRYPYHNITNTGKQGVHLGCFSKYPILSSRAIESKSISNGAVMYELKIGQDTVMLMNCHLESNKLTKEDKVIYEDILKAPETNKVKRGTRQLTAKLAEASILRAEQARRIAQEIAASRCSYILVCGDFNDIATSYTYRIISNRLKDAFTESGCGWGISYNQNKFYFRIDHILTGKQVETYNCTVDRSIQDSDHYPIKCRIAFP
jgi:endonuclease/exonuclease/phosphatase family metal-dependent hydrolase